MVKTMAPIRPEIHEFINYFEDTWLVSQFPPVLWNVFNNDAHNPKTNNHVKGWHNKLKRITRKAHPNIYEIVTIFKQHLISIHYTTTYNYSYSIQYTYYSF